MVLTFLSLFFSHFLLLVLTLDFTGVVEHFKGFTNSIRVKGSIKHKVENDS